MKFTPVNPAEPDPVRVRWDAFLLLETPAWDTPASDKYTIGWILTLVARP